VAAGTSAPIWELRRGWDPNPSPKRKMAPKADALLDASAAGTHLEARAEYREGRAFRRPPREGENERKAH
jgi:hypothetical protein